MKKFSRQSIPIILSILFFTPFLSSCGFKDIDKRIFVQGIAIDYTDNEEKPYKVTLKLAIPTGSLKESLGGKYAYLSREDSSIAGAIRILKTHTDKELDFGHSRIILLGETLLNHNVEEVMDFLFRRRDIQMVAWVAVGDPTAEKVLKAEPKTEMAASNVLTNLFSQNGVESAYVVSTFLFDMRRKLLEPGIDPVLPVVQVNEDEKKLKANKSVVLKVKSKHTHLSSKFTKSYNVLANNNTHYDLRIQEENHHFLFAIDSVNIKYKIDTSSKETPTIKLKITLRGIVEESFEDMSPKELDKYSRIASKAAKKNITDFLKMTQEENIDPMGFGLRYRATRLHNRDTFAEWKEIYPNLQFDVNVKASVESTGTIE
ncbi:Ger(x)C family spore germination protein [Lederbergia ruris]|uniref:Ger(x)C family spore germination protein n=1 Tax=Lederbergia ruris TaxID=217495 RepID=UPI00130ECEF5